jgi:biotin-dependent carboxylase-like uncharacterized protein
VRLEVLDGGLQTTVQDAGRPGLGHLGVPQSGAADPWSLAVANALLANDPGAAALELTLVGPELRAIDSVVVALAGADLGGTATAPGAQAVRMRPGRSIRLAPGTSLRFPGPVAGETGIRSYLALPGGVDVPIVLGSRSTALAAAFGGHAGRALTAGDVVRPLLANPDALRSWPSSCAHPLAGAGGRIRVLPGPDATSAGAALEGLCEVAWTVRPDSDRMGLRLEGPLLAGGAGELLTAPTVWGAIQLPPGGGPIVLLADHQPTGGYPVIAVAIMADRPALGQLGPGAAIRFELVQEAAAREALATQRGELAAATRSLVADGAWDDLWRDAGA